MYPPEARETLRNGDFFDHEEMPSEGTLLERAARAIRARGHMSEEELRATLRHARSAHAPQVVDLGHRVGVLRVKRLADVHSLHALIDFSGASITAADGARVDYVWVVFGKSPEDELLEPFGWMLVDHAFGPRAVGAETRPELLQVYEEYLEHCHTPEPGQDLPPELDVQPGFLGGLRADVRRRAKLYGSDFTDGLNPKALASVLFLFFACLAPAVAFGGLLSLLTGGQLGAIEMIMATAICGTIYALASGQPLTILGSTGPVIIFIGILYDLCEGQGVEFFHAYVWVGIWTALILAILALTEASRLIRFFTRFTDETFAGLIAIIFIVEALKDTFSGFADESVPHDTALLSLILALGTYMVANQLSRFRRSPYLVRPVREFLADFGPAIAILAMTGVAFWLHPVDLVTLDVPAQIQPSVDRSWLIDPFEAPGWVIGVAFVPAVLMSILLYLDQNITTRLVNSPDNRLQKGAGYHLDLLVVALLVAVCSLLGLPWMVAATVRSLNHVRSLADTKVHGGAEQIVKVRENRLTGLVVHLLIGTSLLFLTYLAEVPMSVLFGLFLYMGIATMRGNQLFERMRLWVLEPGRYPPTHYVRRVPRRVIHKFTLIQTACLAVLWAVKTSIVGIAFPLFIALLVPIRMLLGRFFDDRYLRFLDAEEDPEEEKETILD